jgi:hypothetical protein
VSDERRPQPGEGGLRGGGYDGGAISGLHP